MLKNHIIPKKKITKTINPNILAKFRSQYIVIPHKKVIDEKAKVVIPLVKPDRVKKVKLGLFTISAYDLSVQSCTKSRGDSGFGVTDDGTKLKNKTWNNIKVISVDPRIIPLNSKVKITFVNKKYAKYSDIYRSADTGPGIMNNHIDLFLGDFGSSSPSREATLFGTVEAYVEIIKED